jgi:hypothetical protein
MAQLMFDAQTVAPQTSFAPIPAGVYTTTVVDSEVKPTKNGTGQMAVFTLQVLDGQFSGRKLFARINVRNQNPQAEQIGQSQLSALCHAAGVLQLQDTAQLHGRVVRAKVKIRKDTTGQYDDQNEVTGYEAMGGGGATPAANTASYTPPAAAQAQTSATPATPPWAKKVA